jgi:hypothetical protein
MDALKFCAFKRGVRKTWPTGNRVDYAEAITVRMIGMLSKATPDVDWSRWGGLSRPGSLV